MIIIIIIIIVIIRMRIIPRDQVGVWWGIVVSHGQEGLFSLGWQPS